MSWILAKPVAFIAGMILVCRAQFNHAPKHDWRINGRVMRDSLTMMAGSDAMTVVTASPVRPLASRATRKMPNASSWCAWDKICPPWRGRV